MDKEKEERIVKAANGALRLFAELGLTLDETEKAANEIKDRARLQGAVTKLDPDIIKTAVIQHHERVEKATADFLRSTGTH
jgi:hypothetical protein